MTGTRAHLISLAERRMHLMARARSERDHLASVVARTDRAAAVFERVRGLLDQLRRQPWILVAAGGLLIALQPRRTFGWLMKGWSAWRLYRGAQRWWNQFVARSASAGGGI
jgi:hypothetical protein